MRYAWTLTHAWSPYTLNLAILILAFTFFCDSAFMAIGKWW
jgi:hypothetical protein